MTRAADGKNIELSTAQFSEGYLLGKSKLHPWAER